MITNIIVVTDLHNTGSLLLVSLGAKRVMAT